MEKALEGIHVYEAVIFSGWTRTSRRDPVRRHRFAGATSGDLRPLGSPRQRDFGGVLSIGLRRCQIPLLEITTQLKSQIATMAGPVDLGKYLPHL